MPYLKTEKACDWCGKIIYVGLPHCPYCLNEQVL